MLMSPIGSLADSPAAGLWRTFDDHTGEARGFVRIFELNGVLHGRVEKILIPADQGRVCERCEGARKDKPILGMEIFDDLRPSADGWEGHILDPQTGKVYSCKAHLAEGGQDLVLRGYVLVSLLGRSQTWKRVNNAPG